MAAFDDFDLQEFKQAFNTTDDIDAYNRVQAVERALGRVQNFVADLAQAGSRLAQLPPPDQQHTSPAHRAFASLRDAGVISNARTTIEHGYLGTTAGNVHRAAQLIRDSAREFIGPFRSWIAPYLADQGG